MAKDLISAITRIQAIATGLSGVSDPGHAALDNVDEAIFALTEPASGELTVSTFGLGIHSVRCLIACKADDYARYRASLIPLVESFYTAILADKTLSGTCTQVNGLSYTYGPTQHGAYPVYGAIFTITVKIT